MKKYLFIAALLAAAALVSCENKEVAEQPAGNTVTLNCVLEEPAPGSRLSISDQGKVAWEPGDQILIHGGHIRDGEWTVVTLSEEDISADGKTARVAFDAEEVAPYDRSADGISSTYYAAYPYSATANNESCYYYNRFGDTNAPLIAGYNEGNTLKMHKLTAVIAFKAYGEFDRYEFVGNSKEAVGLEFYQVKLTGGEKGEENFKHTLGGSLTSIEGALSNKLNFIHIPTPSGSIKFSEGFTIRFFDGDNLVKVATSVTPVEIPRGGMLNLGDISSHLKDYVAPTTSDHKSDIPTADAIDLSENGTANCYIVSAAGIYKLPAVQGNSNEPAGEVFGADILWETFNNADDVPENSIIEAVDFEDNWLYFKVPATFKPGNALIAARNNLGKIIWSWHIWVPITTPSNDDFGLGRNMMDRNLGALQATVGGSEPVSVLSVGMLYQWGRKDPFPGPRAIDDEDQAKVAGTPTSVVHEQTTYAKTTEMPTTMYTFDDGDWLSTPNNSLWNNNGVKTVDDPCPAGYRVPSLTDLAVLDASDYKALEGWAWDTANYWFKVGFATFPVCGYVDDYDTSFGVDKLTQRVAYWFADNDSDKAGKTMDVRFDKDYAKRGASGKSRGAYVRCVVE